MSHSNDSDSENRFNLRPESNDEINPLLNEDDLNLNFQSENIFEHYQESIPENNQFYNNFYQNQNAEEENNDFEFTPKNSIALGQIIDQISVNQKKEEILSFDNILDENEGLNNSLTKTILFKTVHNNKEKKEEKEKKEKKEKKKKKEKKEKKEEKDKKKEKEKKEEIKKNENLLGKKHGRKPKDEQYDDDSRTHSGTELGNMIRKIITSFTRYVHYFIKNYTNNNKLIQPTISALYEEGEDKVNRRLINSHEKIRELVQKTVYTFYHDYAFPKNVNGSKKIKDAEESEKNRQDKMAKYKKNVEDIIENEKKEEEKKSTAILDLKIINLLDVFLDYGYETYDNKKIEIDEKKYGFKYIDLQDFATYKQIRYEFSKDDTKQNHYRTHLKKILYGK